jgi:hypothetical protein
MLAEMDVLLSQDEREYHEAMDELRRVRSRIDLIAGRLDGEIERLSAELGDITGRLGTLESSLQSRQIVNSTQSKLIQDMIAIVALTLHEKTRKPKTQCFAEVHEDFKTAFRIPIYSFLPAEQMEAAIAYLGARWRYYNPGQPLPEIFGGSHQPSLL